MATPSNKTEEVENALTNLFGFDRRDSINNNVCIPKPFGCGGPAVKFRDKISEHEYRISGLCQRCQDKAFGGLEMMKEIE